MNRTVYLLLTILFVGCAKHEDPAQLPDSLLKKPMTVQETAPAVIDSGNGLIIDAGHMRTEEHQQLLQRFEPLEVVHIYHDYRPLRKAGTKDKEIKAFLKSHKLTHDELIAILDEGDRLGWSTPR
jgi:hypothetical protein